MKTDVIIVGAGPTGLSLACQLIRYNVDFVICDKKEGITAYSKAIGIQARTLELYEQIGLAQKAIDAGTIAGKANLIEGGEVRGTVELSEIGKGLSPYPFMLVLEQSKHEHILYDFVKSHGKDVYWQTELASFSQNGAGVNADIKIAGGETLNIESKFLVGCDGAKSVVRRGSGATFEGSTFERLFYVADAQVDWKFDHDALAVCLAQNTITAFFPMPGEKRFRIVGTFPENSERDPNEILYEEIERQIKEDTKLELDVSNVNWFSTYKVHSRRVNKFREGRCFLAGDSAHIHTPAGGQGMNTGIQDAYNLAWKLAAVIKNGADAKILDSYDEERLENAKNLLETTDRIFEFGASPDRLIAFLRTNIFPHLANFVLNFDTVKRFIFPLISQTGINYRHSSLSQHEGDKNFKVKAGDRMPYFIVEGKSIYDFLREPKFHLLTFDDGQNETASTVETLYDGRIDHKTIALYPHIAEAFGATSSFQVLLRPDNYIAMITPNASSDGVNTYLEQFFKQNTL